MSVPIPPGYVESLVLRVSRCGQNRECDYCETEYEVASSTVPRPCDDLGHAWRQVPESGTFAENVDFWRALRLKLVHL